MKFKVVKRDGCRYRTLTELSDYKIARRIVRRLMFKQLQGLIPLGSYEVTRVENGLYHTLSQPLYGNYGKQSFSLEGYVL